MKYLLLTALIASNAFAFDYEAVEKTNKKYCELKVEAACKTVKCMENPEECMKDVKPDPEKVKAMQALMAKCGEKDPACLQKEADIEKKNAESLLGPECAKGKQDACYQLDLIKAMHAPGKGV